MQLAPRVTTDRIITGKVTGLTHKATPETVERHLQQHAWYEGVAPSLRMWLISQSRVGMDDDDPMQARDEAYFQVLASEYGRALQIPRIGSSRPLLFAVHVPSDEMRCHHCRKTGQIERNCAAKEQMNAVDGYRGPCDLCHDFSHIAKTCPMRSNPTAVCTMCSQGKHRAMFCPKMIGTYRATPPPQQKQAHTQAQTQSNTQHNDWKNQQRMERMRQGGHPLIPLQGSKHGQEHGQTEEQKHQKHRTQRQEQRQRRNSAHTNALTQQIATLVTTMTASHARMDAMQQTITALSNMLNTLMAQLFNNNGSMLIHNASNSNTGTSTTILGAQQPYVGRRLNADKNKAVRAHGNAPTMDAFLVPTSTAKTAPPTKTAKETATVAAATTASTASTTTTTASATAVSGGLQIPKSKQKRQRTESMSEQRQPQAQAQTQKRTHTQAQVMTQPHTSEQTPINIDEDAISPGDSEMDGERTTRMVAAQGTAGKEKEEAKEQEIDQETHETTTPTRGTTTAPTTRKKQSTTRL